MVIGELLFEPFNKLRTGLSRTTLKLSLREATKQSRDFLRASAAKPKDSKDLASLYE